MTTDEQRSTATIIGRVETIGEVQTIGAKGWVEAARVSAVHVKNDTIASLRACEARVAVTLPAQATPRTVDALLAAAVTVEELAVIYVEDHCRGSNHGENGEMCCIASGLRAVLDRLAVTLIAPVDPEALLNKYYGSEPSRDSSDRELIADMRAALTAAGVPVTPERCQ